MYFGPTIQTKELYSVYDPKAVVPNLFHQGDLKAVLIFVMDRVAGGVGLRPALDRKPSGWGNLLYVVKFCWFCGLYYTELVIHRRKTAFLLLTL